MWPIQWERLCMSALEHSCFHLYFVNAIELHPILQSHIGAINLYQCVSCLIYLSTLGLYCLTQTGASHILNDKCSFCRSATLNIKPRPLMVAKKMSLYKAFQETECVKASKWYPTILFQAYSANILFKEEIMFVLLLQEPNICVSEKSRDKSKFRMWWFWFLLQ